MGSSNPGRYRHGPVSAKVGGSRKETFHLLGVTGQRLVRPVVIANTYSAALVERDDSGEPQASMVRLRSIVGWEFWNLSIDVVTVLSPRYALLFDH